jgi:AcrR family transcriptional regulator
VGRETRVLLVESAERLIGERGVHGVSLREIGAEAGQRNTGAVRYHFGTKKQLVDAVFEHRMVAINQRRLAFVAELDAAGQGHELRGLIEAFLHPLAEVLGEPGRPSWYLRFCVQASLVDGSVAADLDAQPWTRGIAAVQRRAHRHLVDAGVPAALVAERWALAIGYLTHALADRELLAQYEPRRVTSPRAAFLAHLTDTAVALAAATASAAASAPTSAPTSAPASGQAARPIDDRRSA